MAIGFYKQPRLIIYGDGDGNVVFEEFMDNDCKVLTARIAIDWDRFEQLQNHCDNLRHEAFHGIEESNNEA